MMVCTHRNLIKRITMLMNVSYEFYGYKINVFSEKGCNKASDDVVVYNK